MPPITQSRLDSALESKTVSQHFLCKPNWQSIATLSSYNFHICKQEWQSRKPRENSLLFILQSKLQTWPQWFTEVCCARGKAPWAFTSMCKLYALTGRRVLPNIPKLSLNTWKEKVKDVIQFFKTTISLNSSKSPSLANFSQLLRLFCKYIKIFLDLCLLLTTQHPVNWVPFDSLFTSPLASSNAITAKNLV